jgi:hypothetical protein
MTEPLFPIAIAEAQAGPPWPPPEEAVLYIVAAWSETGKYWQLQPRGADGVYYKESEAAYYSARLSTHWRHPRIVKITLGPEAPTHQDERKAAPLVVLGQGDFTAETHEEDV